MRQYSIIVPAIGGQVWFEKTLASVLRYLPPGSEVVVPCPYDFRDVHGLEGEVNLVRLGVKTKPELPQLFRAALEYSTKELVGLFLPGVELTGDWHLLVSPQFDDPEMAAVSPVVLSMNEDSVQLPNHNAVMGLRIDRQFGRRIVGSAKRGGHNRIDGPLALAAIYRNEAFGWLKMDQTGLSTESLEIELAAGLKSLGYVATVLPEWFLSCDSKVLENWTSSRIEGDVQECVIRRHSTSGPGGLSLRVLFDLFRGRAGSAFGRLLSIRHRRRDQLFNNDLMQGKLDRQKLRKAVIDRRAESPQPKTGRRAA